MRAKLDENRAKIQYRGPRREGPKRAQLMFPLHCATTQPPNHKIQECDQSQLTGILQPWTMVRKEDFGRDAQISLTYGRMYQEHSCTEYSLRQRALARANLRSMGMVWAKRVSVNGNCMHTVHCGRKRAFRVLSNANQQNAKEKVSRSRTSFLLERPRVCMHGSSSWSRSRLPHKPTNSSNRNDTSRK